MRTRDRKREIDPDELIYTGLTMRHYIATQAMEYLLDGIDWSNPPSMDEIGERAYAATDGLIRASGARAKRE